VYRRPICDTYGLFIQYNYLVFYVIQTYIAQGVIAILNLIFILIMTQTVR